MLLSSSSTAMLMLLLCVGVALVSGVVLPLAGEEGRGLQYRPRYALLVPLNEETDALNQNYNDDKLSQLPLVRLRRQVDVSGGVTRGSGGGTTVDAAARGQIYQNGPHTVTGNGHVERTYGIPGVGKGPVIYGGGVNYDHATRGGAGVDLTRTPMGTQMTAKGKGTVWESRDRNSRVEAHGSYSRNYGGPYGSSRPNYGVGATYTRRFK